MTWKLRAGIGAVPGGLLIVIQLVGANFYLGQPRELVIGGLLTALAFLLIATAWTALGDEVHKEKLVMRGHLAPSVLIALVTAGPKFQSGSPGFPGVRRPRGGR